MNRRVQLGGIAGAILLAAFGAQAQPTPIRTIEGKVISFSGVPIPHATVYLRASSRPGAVKMDQSSADGGFEFSGLYLAEEYDVWASFKGRTSAVKTVPSLSNRRVIHLDLEIR